MNNQKDKYGQWVINGVVVAGIGLTQEQAQAIIDEIEEAKNNPMEILDDN